MLRLHGNEGTKQGARAQLLNIAAEDAGEERSCHLVDDLVAEVAAYECRDTFVRVDSTMQQSRLA